MFQRLALPPSSGDKPTLLGPLEWDNPNLSFAYVFLRDL
jgi:hypothetical protein